MLEREFQKTVTSYLKRNDIFFIKTNTGLFYKKIGEQYIPMSMMTKGVSDLIIYHDSKTIFVELKTDKTYQNQAQKEFEINIKSRGFYYMVLKPKNWKEFKENIKHGNL